MQKVHTGQLNNCISFETSLQIESPQLAIALETYKLQNPRVVSK